MAKNLVNSNNIEVVTSGDDLSLDFSTTVKQKIEQIEINKNNIANLKGKILWTNPNPSNLIPNDLNINILSDEDYDILGVYYKTANDSVDVEYNQTIKGMNFNIGTIGYNGTGLRRRITKNSKTSYTIKQYNGETLSDSATGKYIIPLYIVGYKTGLFG